MRTQSAEDRVVVAAKKDFHRTAVDFDSDEFLLPISSYFDLRCCEWHLVILTPQIKALQERPKNVEFSRQNIK